MLFALWTGLSIVEKILVSEADAMACKHFACSLCLDHEFLETLCQSSCVGGHWIVSICRDVQSIGFILIVLKCVQDQLTIAAHAFF